MKTLYLIRHAKSSWDDLSLSDFDRPLNKRGKNDAPRMGKRLKEKRVVPDLMLTSAAKRARATCTRIAEVLNYGKERIVAEPGLYHAAPEALLKAVRRLNDKHQTVFLFGHNPGLTEFLNEVTDTFIDNIPTCGVAAIQFQVNAWQDIDWHSGKLVYYDYPKNQAS